MPKSAWSWLLALILLIGSGSMLSPNLGRHHLWQDEAQTALISKTVLDFGKPHGFDEKNSFSQELGAESNQAGIYKWHPWLPFYIHAIAFHFLGKSDWVARFPDAVFGVGTVLICFWTMQAAGRGNRRAFLAAAILTCMVPFLLLSRHCRYYSMASFFSMACLWSYLEFQKNRKNGSILLGLSSLLLFHTQIIYCFTLWMVVIVHSLLFERKNLKELWAPLLITGLGTIPWLIYVRDISYFSHYHHAIVWQYCLEKAYAFGVQLVKFILPISIFPFGLLVILWKKKHPVPVPATQGTLVQFLLLYIMIDIVILSAVAPAAFFRYLSTALPVCALLIAEIIDYGFCVAPVFGGIGLLLLLINQPVADYLYELTHNFRGPMEGLVEYLAPRIQPERDLIAITYGDMPLKWYLNVRVIGGLTGEKLEESKNARWVILRKYKITDKDQRVFEYLIKNVPWNLYQKVALNAPDTQYENRESPQLHLYRTAGNEDPVVIFERIEK
jgi:4-amino-4-deoxy-L-arabinose transferase-like glycosyltransferase